MRERKIELLTTIVDAHEQVHQATGSREPLMFIRFAGGHEITHHAISQGDLDGLDEAMLEEMQAEGLIDLDYREHNTNFRPTALAHSVVEQHKRLGDLQPTADLSQLSQALKGQLAAEKKFAWTAVRPVLEALRSYWEESGFPQHGVNVGAIIQSLPAGEDKIFEATMRALLEGGYVAGTSDLAIAGIPAEVIFTDRTRAILEGWPGATPTELVENLLAVINAISANEANPEKKRRLEKLAETVKEVGVSTAGEVLAKVLIGA